MHTDQPWDIARYVPEPARRTAAERAYYHHDGRVRVDATGRCPMAVMLHHPLLHPHRRWVADDDRVPDSATEVAVDLYRANGIEVYPQAAESEEAALIRCCRQRNAIAAAVQRFCDAWDTGVLDDENLPAVLGITPALADP